MALIKTIKSKLGEIIYPITKEKAVYDDNNVRLDNKLSVIDTNFDKRVTPRIIVATQTELDSAIDNVSSVNGEWYRLSVNVNAELSLHGGIWYIEGNKINANYEWQYATTYYTTRVDRFSRQKWNGVWQSWRKDLNTADLIQNDITGGTDKAFSAEAGKVHGAKIDSLLTVTSSTSAIASHDNNVIVQGQRISLHGTLKKLYTAMLTNKIIPANTYTTIATISQSQYRPAHHTTKVVLLEKDIAGYLNITAEGEIRIFPFVQIESGFNLYITEVI